MLRLAASFRSDTVSASRRARSSAAELRLCFSSCSARRSAPDARDSSRMRAYEQGNDSLLLQSR